MRTSFAQASLRQRKTLSSALASENVLDEFASSLEKLVEEAEEQSSMQEEDTPSLFRSSSGVTLAQWMCNVRAFIEAVSDAAKDAILASIASSSCESVPKLRGSWSEKAAREALLNVEFKCEEAREALNPYVKLSFAAVAQASSRLSSTAKYYFGKRNVRVVASGTNARFASQTRSLRGT